MSGDQHDVAKLRADLQKYNDDESMLLKVLDLVLESDINRSILKTTGIGKTISKLAKDERVSVANKSKPILEKWKALAKEEKQKPNGSMLRSISSSSTLFNSIDPVDSGELVDSGKLVDTTPVDTSDIKLSRFDPINLPIDPTRKRFCNLLQGIFKEEEHSVGAAITSSVGAHLELAMCSALGACTSEYKAKYRSLKTNMQLNSQLKTNVLTGAITPSDLISMSDEQLRSKEHQEAAAKAKAFVFEAASQDWHDKNRDAIDKLAGVQNRALFFCGKCGSDRTTNYQKQTRSADEPMTVFVACVTCGNKWRC